MINAPVFRRVLALLGDLRLAILLLLVIAIASMAGTVIEQGQSLSFYQANYPENPALFGFLSWRVLLALGLDHVYRTPWYLTLLVLFGASLTACTLTRQVPALTTAQRWHYYQEPRQFTKLALSTTIPQGSLTALATALRAKGYRVWQTDTQLYARKGLVGRLGPIVVHASMLLILLGGILGALTGFMAQELIPSGETVHLQHIVEAGPLARIPQDWSVKVNRFWIDYTDAGEIDQFYSDLSIQDAKGQEVKRGTIHVNRPLRYGGVSLYQADWGIAAIRFRLNRSPVLQLPMAPLDTGGKGRLWGTWLPTRPDLSAGVSLIARDLQGTVLLYGPKGEFLTSLRTGMSTEVNGVTLTLVELVGSTGLQIKADPGIPLFYAGFALLMAGVIMSYVSHSQVWGLQENQRLYLGGRTNRAQLAFEQELVAIARELAPPSQTTAVDL
ncbi:cytochrome c biogenesis protein [Thermosynechococcus vestitus]|uniref:Cytochrome c biogenesis protein CcsB n=1 Tax=Thermosynechococcus vestitus (strain NIES-2133 / IAM M-273 / BP-1) TaxID=197221 RepID=CCS1_THEVB|nr:cytochrome c biogenesis protein [Thermosynechococcus vestitus]Q8DL16.1 RecName: Full=Cytochrome c biogenesis protein CcsB [Thermosynechococcus vestitus BP-1]BAC08234.1 c-type cytochrome biogenesis protein [Thermosynechococcus vestitus BP-1]